MLSVVVIFSGLAALAQNGASISGTVKDQNDAVVPGATVRVINTASDSVRTTVTDQGGKYMMGDLTAGPYRVTVFKTGFSEIGANMNLGSSDKATQDFSLGLGGLREDVTVTAARGLRATSEIPQTVTVVSDEEMIARRPIGVADAYDKAPSVLSTDSNPYRTRPQIRGLQSSRVLVTVDGERLNNARFAADFVGVSPSLVDTSQIQAVEVVVGSASSLYGSDAIGGTVNIITKGAERSADGPRVDMRVDGDYGSNNKYRKGAFAGGYGDQHFAIRGNVSRFIFPSYKLGSQGISRSDVIRFGNLARQAGNAIGQNVVGSYAVYDFPSNGLVTNSQAKGVLGGLDVQMFPVERQTIRIRYQTNSYKNLGVGFSGIPTGVNQATTGNSSVDKFSGRYEVREFASWFPRMVFSGFRQEYDRRLDEVRNNVVVGSSCVAVTGTTPPFATTCPSSTTFTGNVSSYVLATIAHTRTDTVTKGADAQFNFIPFKNALYITGVGYSSEKSHDAFAQDTYNAAGVITASLVDVRNVPDTTYRNTGWYNQFEYTPIKYFRFAGGFRYDKWKTEARPVSGFPVGNVASIIAALIPRVQAAPGALNVNGALGTLALAQGSTTLKTDSPAWTYNVGATFFVPGGINPYVRYSTSFREPGLTDKFLVRNFFSSPNVLSFVGFTNTDLKPERGRDIDVGVKVNRSKVRGSFAVYQNRIKDATGTVTGSYCLAANPAVGILAGGCTLAPGPPPTLGHLGLVFQTVNFASVKIRGWEVEAEGDVRLGDLGSITPYFSLGYIKARNEKPDANRVAVINQFYNSSAPLELEGSATDVPFYSLPKYKYAFAPKFTSANGMWWLEYELRGTTKVTRVDPAEISQAQATQYYYFAAYKGFQKQAIRGGFKVGEKNPLSITLGVDNLADRTYFSLFQPTPSMGRSFTFGATYTFSRLIK